MFKSIPKKNNNKGIIIAKEENAFLQRDKQIYTIVTPKACIKIGNVIVDAMLDSSTKVNIITRSLANIARLIVQTNLILVLKIVSISYSKKIQKIY